MSSLAGLGHTLPPFLPHCTTATALHCTAMHARAPGHYQSTALTHSLAHSLLDPFGPTPGMRTFTYL